MTEAFRWASNFHSGSGAFGPLWSKLAEDTGRVALLVAGRGFDPRTCEVPRALVESGTRVSEVRLLHLHDRYYPQHSPDQTRQAELNERSLRKLFAHSSFSVIDIDSRTRDGRVTGGFEITRFVDELSPLGRFSDVIVDITGLPTSIYFPLIAAFLAHYDADANPTWNLHGAVCENVEIDELVTPEGGDQAERMFGLGPSFDLTSDPDAVRVWAPVLGEGQRSALSKIRDTLGADEVKPVLPFPSRDPRRGDRLIAEYRTELLDEWEVDLRGILYADEQDPFDLYLQLSRLHHDYAQALRPLGNSTTILSSHTSKLLSLGVLLAAFEHELPVMHVEPTSYGSGVAEASAEQNELFDVWLAGEPYDGVTD